ncbi:MAG: hypothetical protein ABW321_17380 [Polyangiales bacterium]
MTASIALADATDERASLVVRASGHSGSVERIQGPDALPIDVNAGTIPRALLNAELDRGIGRFLQHVKVQAQLEHREFVGWKLLSLFQKRPEVQVKVLRAGDVVTRINGASIERPEEFQVIWDALRTAKELVLDIERDGQSSKLHYRIEG